MMVVDGGSWQAAVIVGATIIAVGAAFVAAITNASYCAAATVVVGCVALIASSI